MRESTFKFIHDNAQSNINRAHTININIEPDESGTTKGSITSLTVTITDYFSTNENNLTQLLQQVENIEFTLTYFDGTNIESNNSSKIKLEIISKERRSGYTGEKPYFYFRVNPVVIDDIRNIGPNFKFSPANYPTSYNELQDPNFSTTIFTPIISNINFLTSDFNPVLSNATDIRKSTFLQISDRNQLTSNPSNISSLFAGTATPAQIPDSNYTDTGITNSKYQGSKTSAESFGGIEPALTGKIFDGIVFSDQLSNEEVTGSDLSNSTVVGELLHTGPSTLPTFTTASTSIRNTSEITADAASFEYNFAGINQGLSNIDIGNIIIIDNERLRILKNDTKTYSLLVERGYEESTATQHDPGSVIKLIVPTRIFKFDDSETKIIAADNSKVYLKENKQVMQTDKFGVIFSGSIQSDI